MVGEAALGRLLSSRHSLLLRSQGAVNLSDACLPIMHVGRDVNLGTQAMPIIVQHPLVKARCILERSRLCLLVVHLTTLVPPFLVFWPSEAPSG